MTRLKPIRTALRKSENGVSGNWRNEGVWHHLYGIQYFWTPTFSCMLPALDSVVTGKQTR